MTGMELLDT